MRKELNNTGLTGKASLRKTRGTAVPVSGGLHGDALPSGQGPVRMNGITVRDQGAALKQLLALGIMMGMLAAFVFTSLPGVQASRLRELQVPSHPGRAPDGLLIASPSQSLQSMVAGLEDESDP